MKKIVLILFIFFGTATSYAQSAKEMLKEIEGKWKLDENGNVVFTRKVEMPGHNMQELFNRSLEYYRSHYGNARSVSQTSDPNTGKIIRKGVFDNAHTGYTVLKAYVDAWHIFTLTATDNTVELSVVLTEYEEEYEQYGFVDEDSPRNIHKSKVQDNYPVNPNGGQKTIMTKAFYKAYKASMESLDAIERGLKG